MPNSTFRALLVEASEQGQVVAIRDLQDSDLPKGDVTIDIHYSDLNYKDGLAVTGTAKVLRSLPLVPGIDFAGTVIESQSAEYKPGDNVVLTGWGIGETHWGGFTQRNRVRAEWLVALPHGMSLRHSMAIGTAGFTAMLCVMALEDAGIRPSEREVLVTGAAGGVGSIAVALLAAAGYLVVAATGRSETSDYLRSLGAKRIIDRNELSSLSRPLEREQWCAAIDTVGDILSGVLRSTMYYGAVAACGNAGGVQFTSSVFPFILRGIHLVGVESVLCPPERRRAAWARLARDLRPDVLDNLHDVISLDQVPEYSQRIIAGQIRGRTVISTYNSAIARNTK